jgi:hypothetical protein
MSAISFEYVKQGATEPKPKLMVPLVQPTNKYFGIDITELDPEDQGTFMAEIDKVLDLYKKNVDDLMEKYDIKHNYRYYFPDKMTNVIIED